MSVRRAWRWTVSTVVSPVVSLAFPESCWVTREPLPPRSLGLGEASREKIARGLLASYCQRCGASIGPHTQHDQTNPCMFCEDRPLGVLRIARVGTYSEPLAPLIKALKFQRHWELAPVLAPFLYQALMMQDQGLADDQRVPVEALVPVALHWRRRWSRGFNQSHELANQVGKLGGWPVWDVLRRIRATREQSQVHSVPQRRENLRGAFACGAPERVAGKHLCLIDDVCTTGATLHAAARALLRLPKEYRPASVRAAVLCVTDHRTAAE